MSLVWLIPGKSVRQYDYTPLPQGHSRLLSLHPGQTESPLVAKIFNAQLIELRRTPYYGALSYTWGDPDDAQMLMIGMNPFLMVTPNLRDALVRLRHTDRPRTLRIDAVCINQNDSAEKSRQVVLMTQIYSVADKVLV
ncbi:HET-domain-containing protein [Setomelanomma holmii]|uniref:HET-domain-containing protein n=1 Tax=Setomelanomma holmii TaxID=210430 RepID=A0A9P4H4E5_9PLEO|nr:HET-domain-containing protein [Setomelanomma holmii]